MEGISAAYLFKISSEREPSLRPGWRAIMRGLIYTASELEPLPLFLSPRKGLRIEFSGCLSHALYAVFETRLKYFRVTRCHSGTSAGLLEMICGESNQISGGWNEELTGPLIGYRKCGKSFTEGENERKIKGRVRVVLRPVSLHLVSCEE